MKSYLQFHGLAVLGCLAGGIIASATTMTVDSISGAVTTNEVSSFKTYMATVAPATNNLDNLLSHNQGGENLEGLGVMYEVTGDQAILDRFIQFADAALAARNSTTTGLINWDGNREPTWPIGSSGSDEEPTTEAENGDVIAHIAYCAQLILERGQQFGSTFLNSAPSVGDPDGFGSTYLSRATTYINACDDTEQNYMLVWFVNASHQYYTPADTRYTGWHNSRPFPWNQQMMMNGGLERLAVCHQLLGDNSPYIAQYNQIVQTSVSAFVADLEANQTTASNGDPVYVWSYFADPPSVAYSVEDNSAHSSYDLLGLFRAYEQGGFSVPTSVMVNLANTMSDVIYLGSDFAGNVDGTGTTRSTLWSEWLNAAEFRTDAYTILANADLGSAASNMNYFARLMFEKNRRYQKFGLAASASSLSVVAGTNSTASISVQSLGAYSGTVALTSSGAPSGVSPTFSPTSAAVSVTTNIATSTLTVAAAAGTTAGTYPITLTGTSGGTTQSQVISVTVQASAGGPYTYGCSSLTATNSGGTISTSSDSNATGGVLLYLNSTAAGQWLQLTTPTIPAGTYQVSFRYKQNTNRGRHTITVDGTQLGGVIDQYATTSAYTTQPLGQVNFASGGTHALRLIVSGKDSSSTSYALSADSFVFTAVSGLSGANIGSEPIAGNASLSASTYTVQGCGSDIYNAADQFEYASSATSGDQTVVAEVLSQTNTNAWAKSGVMIRASTAAGSAFVDVSVTPGNGVDMQYRSTTNGSAADLARIASVAAPYWVKLVRSGSTFTGYCSADGLTWTTVGSVSVSMATSVTAGVNVCSHNTASACTTTFGSVSLQ